jgi:hypothetical protein
MSNDEEIASVLYLNATQAKEVLKDPSKIMNIEESIEDYRSDQQLLIDFHAELKESQKDNSEYASPIADLECDLASTNMTIHILQAVATYTALPHIKPIEMPYPHELSGDCKELLNFTSKVYSKLARESTHYIDNQHKLHYIYGFLKGNVQNQIQPYLLPDKIKLKNVESLISILKATFHDPDQVGTTSPDLHKLT